MRAICSITLLFCLILFVSNAADEHFETIQAGEEVFHDVTVTSVTSTDIYFTHSLGMGNAKLKSLSPELQQQFGFDRLTAAEVERSRQEESVVFSMQMQKARELDMQRAAAARLKSAQEAAAAEQNLLRERARLAHLTQGANKKAPEFVVEKWLSVEPKREGKFLLIDFWATWCGPCRKSIPHLNELQQKFSDKLVIVGVSSEAEGDVRLMTAPRIEYYSAIDTQRRMAARIGVSSIPHVLLVDPSGIIRYAGHPAALSEEQLEEILTTFGS